MAEKMTAVDWDIDNVKRTAHLGEKHTGCGVKLTIKQPYVRKDGIPFPWLSVACHWCDGDIHGGCSQCLKHHQALARALAHPTRQALWRAVRQMDGVASLQLADWYRDHVPGLIEEGGK